MEVDKPSTINFKSDNCATQYKSKYIFKQCQLLAKENGMSDTVYYDVSGHGKGLVDAMSGYGVKIPLRRAVITFNFSYRNSLDCS